jgi:hypothetical protein
MVLINNWQWQFLYLIRIINLFKWCNSVSVITYRLHSHCTALVTVSISACSQPADVKPLSQEKIANDRYIHKQRHSAKKKVMDKPADVHYQTQCMIFLSHFTQRVLIGLHQYFVCKGYKVCKERNIFHTHTHTNTYVHAFTHIHKGKAFPLQAWTAPECSRSLRFPVFKTIGTWMW